MKTRVFAFAIAFFAFFTFFVLLSMPAAAAPLGGQQQYRLLMQIDEYIKSEYLLSDSLYKDATSILPAGLTAQQLQDDPGLFDRVIGELTSRLDKYSSFFTAEEYKLAYPKGQSYVGVGVRLDPATPFGVFVDELVEGGSAEAAGLKLGDQIIEVDGLDISGMPYTIAGQYLRGREGTTAEVKVLRPGEAGLLKFSLRRTGLYVPNVTAYTENDTAVISISQFGHEFDYYDFCDIYDGLPDQGVKNVIFDLRDNPGGSLNVLLWILDYIVEGEGVELFSFHESHGRETPYYTTGDCQWVPEKMVVLINEHSASASEIFAGALMDIGAAVTVGNTTSGKARAQMHNAFFSGDVLVLTTNTVSLPKTGDYQDTGVKPDFLVENTPVPYEKPGDWPQIDPSFALFPGVSSPGRVKALQVRLRELGVFRQEPSGVYDWYTQQCVMSAQKAAGIPVTPGYASKAVLGKIEGWLKELEASVSYVEDSQLMKAMELCGN